MILECIFLTLTKIFKMFWSFVLGFINTFWTRIHLIPESSDGWTHLMFSLHVTVWTDEHCKWTSWISTILFLVSWLISFNFPSCHRRKRHILRRSNSKKLAKHHLSQVVVLKCTLFKYIFVAKFPLSKSKRVKKKCCCLEKWIFILSHLFLPHFYQGSNIIRSHFGLVHSCNA